MRYILRGNGLVATDSSGIRRAGKRWIALPAFKFDRHQASIFLLEIGAVALKQRIS